MDKNAGVDIKEDYAFFHALHGDTGDGNQGDDLLTESGPNKKSEDTDEVHNHQIANIVLESNYCKEPRYADIASEEYETLRLLPEGQQAKQPVVQHQ